MNSQPGYFSFRWRPEADEAEDIVVVFKAPGAVDQNALPDLLEAVCSGPVVPTAVVILQFGKDKLVEALQAPALKSSLGRYTGRMPLLVLTIHPTSFAITCDFSLEVSKTAQRAIRDRFEASTKWIDAGLASIFDPKTVVISAPSGYAFRKPSGDRSTYFVRAELGLQSSNAVSFVAFAILKRLISNHNGVPQNLRLLLVDTMNIAAVAFSLRELLSICGKKVLPQIESFHSYGGLENVASPLPDTSLCIVSASSSMNLHRKWIQDKSLSSRDVLTLVTFEDAEGAHHALYQLPRDSRPAEPATSSTYDIQIAGEYFFPVFEPSRKVLLSTTHHGCDDFTREFYLLRQRELFGAFRASISGKLRGLFVNADALLEAPSFQEWINVRVPQHLKAGTTEVVFQDDSASAKLAQHVAYIASFVGCGNVQVRSSLEVSPASISRTAPIVCVAAVVGGGNALMSLNRDLRNVHTGARLYLIGAQISGSSSELNTFDRNLKHSSHKSPIDVLRRNFFLSADAVAESFRNELSLYKAPSLLDDRAKLLRDGPKSDQLFLPSGPQLRDPLTLNVDFAFWPKDYQPAAYQAEVLATIAAVLQNARTANLRQSHQELRSPTLVPVVLDPENFARFNEGIIQAAILRAARPSELDYRGDDHSSSYMATFLARLAKQSALPQVATLEFLVALATKRLQLNAHDTGAVVEAFRQSMGHTSDPLAQAVRFLVASFQTNKDARRAF